MANHIIDDLCRHIEANNFSGVKAAITAGISINQYSAAGLTPLGTSILGGHLVISEYLLNEGADSRLGYRSSFCMDKSYIRSDLPEVCAAIHCASAVGSADLIRLLVNYGSDINDSSAIEYGAEVFPLCLSTGDATQALIDLGADVSRRNTSNFTPLLYAMAREDVSSAKLLVENGAEVEIERISRYRLRIALTNGAEDTKESIVEGTSSPLMVACHQGRLRSTSADMIEILASAGADVNRRYYIKSTDGNVSFTVLALICSSRTLNPYIKGQHAKNDQYGKKEVAAISALISAGADINDPTIITSLCQGAMPFIDFEARLEVIQMLVDHGLQLDMISGQAPLSELLRSFKKNAEAEIQFNSIATVLAKAGAKWDLLKSEMKLVAVPSGIYNRTQEREGEN